jgi:hypothetical protein
MTGAEDQRQLPLRAADTWLLIGGAFGLYFAFTSIGPGLDGRAYLGAFALIWAVLMAGQVIVRHVWRDSFAVSSAAAAVLAGVAISRYVWGEQRGMQRWGFLAIMAALGCASFFIRADGGGDTSSTRSSNGGCGGGGGGCGGGGDGGGGGGCGGGGCGGCGG